MKSNIPTLINNSSPGLVASRAIIMITAWCGGWACPGSGWHGRLTPRLIIIIIIITLRIWGWPWPGSGWYGLIWSCPRMECGWIGMNCGRSGVFWRTVTLWILEFCLSPLLVPVMIPVKAGLSPHGRSYLASKTWT